MMVHHGYKRPGEGYIVGDCPGVNHAPYERSCDLIKVYRDKEKAHLVDEEGYLRKLQAGEVAQLWVAKQPYNRANRDLTESITAGDSRWRYAHQLAISKTESGIRHTKHVIERFNHRISEWYPKAYRTVEEFEAVASGVKAEKKAVKDAARAEREAKKQATRDKQAALEAKRQGLKDAFASELLSLAALPKSEDRARMTFSFLDRFMARKHGAINWLGVGGLRPRPDTQLDEAGIELGLAVREPSGSVHWLR